MGVDCGFDIYPPLERTKENQEQYELFLREVLNTYEPRGGDDAEQGDGGSVVRVNAESEESYIDFEVGEQLGRQVLEFHKVRRGDHDSRARLFRISAFYKRLEQRESIDGQL
jgi:hypothetical protein